MVATKKNFGVILLHLGLLLTACEKQNQENQAKPPQLIHAPLTQGHSLVQSENTHDHVTHDHVTHDHVNEGSKFLPFLESKSNWDSGWCDDHYSDEDHVAGLSSNEPPVYPEHRGSEHDPYENTDWWSLFHSSAPTPHQPPITTERCSLNFVAGFCKLEIRDGAHDDSHGQTQRTHRVTVRTYYNRKFNVENARVNCYEDLADGRGVSGVGYSEEDYPAPSVFPTRE
jgi:hypothetical protein